MRKPFNRLHVNTEGAVRDFYKEFNPEGSIEIYAIERFARGGRFSYDLRRISVRDAYKTLSYDEGRAS